MASAIRKPESDARDYRLVKLDNELEIVLVSDPETNISAAALAVAAGQLQDPPEVQGLAHFCEHMLFLGNEKYPGESDFDSFCASSAGYSNAWTSMDRTVYHFMLAHDKLHDALDRFSGFFSCPLFTEDLTERELMAIDSENNKNLQANHPLQRFGTGSYKTLHDMPKASGTNIRDHLMTFHKGCYSSNIMKLAILGREDLDTLEKWVREFFAAVPNNNLQPLAGVSATDDPFDEGWKGVFRIIPVKERRKLQFYFPMESTYPNFKQKPTRFLSHCIGHEGAGSLLSLLKKKGWATDLSAGTGTQSTHFAIFEISITLTEEGLPNYEAVIQMVFQYINHCLRQGDQAARERIHNECVVLADLSFRGKIDSIIDESFNPSNLRIHIIAPESEQPALPADTTWKEEQWYGTKYSWQALTSDLATKWCDKSIPCQAGLHLPLPNPYTPEQSALKAPQGPASAPKKVIDTATIQCWHVLDTSHGVPKAACHVQLTNFVSEASARCCGLRLTFKGYDDKMPKLVRNILALIGRLDFTTPENQAVFDLVKEKTMTDYRNRRFQQPYHHGMTTASSLFEHPFWDREERMAELETVTSADANEFKKLYLSQLLCEVMVVGNFTAEETASFVSEAIAAISPQPLSAENVPKLRISKLQPGVTVLQEQLGPDPDALDSAICTQFLLGESTLKQQVLLELLCQVMDKEMYSQLRTQEQLGYIVAAVAHNKWQVGSLRCIVQSVQAPSYLEGRLENFLRLFEKKLDELKPEELAEHIESLVTKKLEKDRSAARRCERLMQEVASHTFMFDRRALTKEELCAFYKQFVAVGSPTRTRTSCHVVGRTAVEAMKAAGEEPGLAPESKLSVLLFPAGSVPFPLPPSEDAKEPAPPQALPKPEPKTLQAFRKDVDVFELQK